MEPETTTSAMEPESETTTSAVEPTLAVTTPGSTSSTYRPAPGSHFQCEKPGFNSDEGNCDKFWLCKEETEGSGVLESLLYRCPPGYLFNSAVLRCKKEDASCLETPETRGVNIIQLTEDMLDSFFNKWSSY